MLLMSPQTSEISLASHMEETIIWSPCSYWTDQTLCKYITLKNPCHDNSKKIYSPITVQKFGRTIFCMSLLLFAPLLIPHSHRCSIKIDCRPGPTLFSLSLSLFLDSRYKITPKKFLATQPSFIYATKANIKTVLSNY